MEVFNAFMKVIEIILSTINLSFSIYTYHKNIHKKTIRNKKKKSNRSRK